PGIAPRPHGLNPGALCGYPDSCASYAGPSLVPRRVAPVRHRTPRLWVHCCPAEYSPGSHCRTYGATNAGVQTAFADGGSPRSCLRAARVTSAVARTGGLDTAAPRIAAPGVLPLSNEQPGARL